MENDLDIKCLQCEILLSKYDSKSGNHNPNPEKLSKEKKVAVPNLGWFCSQECGNKFEKEQKMKFQRDVNKEIRYY